jgi:hypothetical protein
MFTFKFVSIKLTKGLVKSEIHEIEELNLSGHLENA